MLPRNTLLKRSKVTVTSKLSNLPLFRKSRDKYWDGVKKGFPIFCKRSPWTTLSRLSSFFSFFFFINPTPCDSNSARNTIVFQSARFSTIRFAINGFGKMDRAPSFSSPIESWYTPAPSSNTSNTCRSTARQKKGLRPLSPPDRVLSFLETVPGRPRDVVRENILVFRTRFNGPHLSLSPLKNTGPPSSTKATSQWSRSRRKRKERRNR